MDAVIPLKIIGAELRLTAPAPLGQRKRIEAKIIPLEVMIPEPLSRNSRLVGVELTVHTSRGDVTVEVSLPPARVEAWGTDMTYLQDEELEKALLELFGNVVAAK